MLHKMGPPKSSDNSSKVAANKDANRRRFLRGVGFGFVLGVCATNMVSLIRESDAHLRLSTQAYDLAAGAMPLIPATSCEPSTKDNANSTVTLPKITPTVTQSAPAPQNIDSKQTATDYTYVKEFDPNLPAVLVTKVHGPHTLPILTQSVCLLNSAYNNRVHYDIVVFSSLPIPEDDDQTKEIRKLVAPANVYFVTDNPGLHEMVDALPPERKAHLLQRCGVESTEDIAWYTSCLEIASTYNISEKIAYSWQAEFRSKHLWVHPVMQRYKYMLWFDSDAFCTKVWQQDPLAMMAKNDLAILFDHFPQGHGRGHELPYRTNDAFGKVICMLDMKNGTLFARKGGCLGKDSRIKLVHGFLHVTNLDFYRSPPVEKWNNVLIGDTKFSRIYDDQIAVTIPAAHLAGNRSWDMRKHGIRLEVVHNGCMDGFKTERVGNFMTWWQKNGQEQFPEAFGKCKVVAGG